MQNQGQKMTELSSVELLEMFQVEELDDRLEMCWVNCNTCTNETTSQNGTCCGAQSNGEIGGGTVTVGGSGPSNTNPTCNP